MRVVVSRLLDLPLMGQLARTARDVPLWLCHGPDAPAELREAWSRSRRTLIAVRACMAGRSDPAGGSRRRSAGGLTRVFCEGGGSSAASLLAAGLVDELVGFSRRRGARRRGQPGIGALGSRTAGRSAALRAGRDAGSAPTCCTAGWRRRKRVAAILNRGAAQRRQRCACTGKNPCTFDSSRLTGPGAGT